MRLDIEDCLAQVESCFNLLVPRFDIPDIFASPESSEVTSVIEPPSRDIGHTAEPVVAEGRGERERKRKRTESSCSFVSLSSGEEESSDEIEGDERSDGEIIGVVPPTLPTCDEERREEDGQMGDDGDFLSHLYTSSSSVSHGQMLRATVSSGTSKGKGKLKNDNAISEVKTVEESVRADSDDDSDSSSDVEWEEVPIPRPESHDPASDLQEHGLTSRGFTIPITIELSSQPEVRETEDNTSIITTLLECKHLLSETYLPKINKWMGVGGRHSC